MLPPPPTAVLDANPHCANLYKHLTEHILCHDGSTKIKSAEYDATQQHLRQARREAAREAILLQALEEVALQTDVVKTPTQRIATTGVDDESNEASEGGNGIFKLPPELQELVLNVVTYLSATLDPATSPNLPPDTDELMSDELEVFQQSLPQISAALNHYLVSTHATLETTANTLFSPPASSSERSRSQPSLDDLIQTQTTSSTTRQQTTLPSTLAITLSTLLSALTSHTNVLHSQIRHLELHTHGTQSRYLTSRATYLAAVSREIELKARITRLEREKSLLSDETLMDRVEEEARSLAREERRLERLEGELVGVLGEYEAAGAEAVARTGRSKEVDIGDRAGEDVFRVFGERYAEIEKEAEEVKRDIERLEGRVGRG